MLPAQGAQQQPAMGYQGQYLPGAPAPPKQAADWKFWIPTSLLTIILLVGLSVGMFFLGAGTRESDDDVAARLISQKNEAEASQAAALRHQKRDLREGFRSNKKEAVRKAEDRGFKNGQEAGYSSGQAAGFSSGKSQGQAEGQAQGYNQGYNQGNTNGFLEGITLNGE